MYVCLCMYICVCVCVYTHTPTHTHTPHTHTYTHTHTHTHTVYLFSQISMLSEVVFNAACLLNESFHGACWGFVRGRMIPPVWMRLTCVSLSRSTNSQIASLSVATSYTHRVIEPPGSSTHPKPPFLTVCMHFCLKTNLVWMVCHLC